MTRWRDLRVSPSEHSAHLWVNACVFVYVSVPLTHDLVGGFEPAYNPCAVFGPTCVRVVFCSGVPSPPERPRPTFEPRPEEGVVGEEGRRKSSRSSPLRVGVRS